MKQRLDACNYMSFLPFNHNQRVAIESVGYWLLLQKNSSRALHKVQLHVAHPLPLWILSVNCPVCFCQLVFFKQESFSNPKTTNVPKCQECSRNIQELKNMGPRTQPVHSCSALSHCAAAFTASSARTEKRHKNHNEPHNSRLMLFAIIDLLIEPLPL